MLKTLKIISLTMVGLGILLMVIGIINFIKIFDINNICERTPELCQVKSSCMELKD